jgi:hypothetical protein
MEDCAVTLRVWVLKVVIIHRRAHLFGADLLYDGEISSGSRPVNSSEKHPRRFATYFLWRSRASGGGFGPLEAARRAHALASEAVEYGLGEIGKGAGPVHVLGRVLEGVEG